MAYNQPQEYIFLKTQTASSSLTLDFTSFITSQYSVYYFKVRQLLPATNNVTFEILLSTDNGSTWLATNYQYNYLFITPATTGNAKSNTGTFGLDITSASNVSTRTINGDYYCFGFGQAVTPVIFGNIIQIDQGGGLAFGPDVTSNTGTTAINAIRFQMSSGNIASGSIDLYASTI